MIFGGEIVSYLVYLGQGEDFKLSTELSEKVPVGSFLCYIYDSFFFLTQHIIVGVDIAIYTRP